MAREIPLPELGENIEEGDVIRVRVAAGDRVEAGRPILDIEAGKATVEVPAPEAGVVGEVFVKEGETIRVGARILALTDDAPAPAPKAAPPAPAAPPVGAGEAPGGPKPETGPAKTADAPPGPAPAHEDTPETPERPLAEPEAGDAARVAAAPAARRFAREIGVTLAEVRGTGPAGRVTIEDVKRHAKQRNTGRATPAHCALEPAALPDFSRWGPVRKEAMSRIRVETAEHLSRAWATIPHVTQFDKADATELEALRKRLAPRAEAAGGRLTLTAILIKLVAAALKIHPKFAASLDLARREIHFKTYSHIGVAVDTDRGLLVPVLRDADRKNILQIARELGALAGRAREGRLEPDDLQGGVFTVTNLGGIGGSFFTPIINAPETAILGVGRAVREPVCGGPDGLCAPRLMLPLSLSYDHRLIDGADGARFLKWLVEAVREPMLISLEG